MKEIKFKSGRIFHIKDDWQAVYILQGCSRSKDENFLAKILLESYGMTNFDNIANLKNSLPEGKKWVNVDPEIIEECLFKDVEQYGEETLCKVMAEFQHTMFYIHSGRAVPDGPLPWE